MRRPSAGDEGPSRVRFVTLDPQDSPGLRGPTLGPSERAKKGPGLVTGGGLVAALDPRQGLIGLWGGREPLLYRVEIRVEERRVAPIARFRTGGGAWSGEYDLGGGFRLAERGLLPDSTTAAVFEWTVRGAGGETADLEAPAEGTPTDREAAPAGRIAVTLVAKDDGILHEAALPLVPGASTTLAVLPPESDVDAARRLLTPLAVRERQRSDRGRPRGAEAFSVSREGRPVSAVVEALRRLDDAPVAGPSSAVATEFVRGVLVRGLLVRGLEDGAPAYLAEDELEEIGTAALYSGRWWIARLVLGSLEGASTTHPAAYLRFAATYAFWTADLIPLTDMTAGFEAALDALTRREPDRTPAIAERLAAAVEPLGNKAFSARLRGLARGSAPGSAAEAGTRAHRRVGSHAVGTSEVRPAARLMRRLIERELGLEADAAYGRLRFAPRLSLSCASLSVAGLRVGDCLVRIGITASEGGHELAIGQEGGRVPLNLVLAPRVESLRPDSTAVFLNGSKVDPDVATVLGGTRIQMQFPLDGPRTIIIRAGGR